MAINPLNSRISCRRLRQQGLSRRLLQVGQRFTPGCETVVSLSLWRHWVFWQASRAYSCPAIRAQPLEIALVAVADRVLP